MKYITIETDGGGEATLRLSSIRRIQHIMPPPETPHDNEVDAEAQILRNPYRSGNITREFHPPAPDPERWIIVADYEWSFYATEEGFRMVQKKLSRQHDWGKFWRSSSSGR